MKALSTLLVFLALAQYSFGQSCNTATGNVVIYANYDGGEININCDVNIPNLKIGVCTYEDCQINITGPFAGNVTEVIYAGFQGDNDNCNSGNSGTSITGVAAGITSVLFAPAGVLSDPNGYGSIICAYSCATGNQGGCNTAAQVVAYFLNEFGGTLHTYYTQYACWGGATYDISDNLCCSVPLPGVETSFTASDPIVCIGQCISFTSSSTGNPTSYTWTFNGANTTSSSAQNPTSICYNTAGTYTANLTASNSSSSDSYSQQITVIDCNLAPSGIEGCTYPSAINYFPSATLDDGSCQFDCVTSNCPADLNDDSVIGVADLLIFLNVFGTTCP